MNTFKDSHITWTLLQIIFKKSSWDKHNINSLQWTSRNAVHFPPNIQEAHPEREFMYNFKTPSPHLSQCNCSYKWCHISWKMVSILLQSCSQKKKKAPVLLGLQFRSFCSGIIRVVLASWLSAVHISFSNPLESCLIKFRIIAPIYETDQELYNPIRLMMRQISEEKSYPIHPYGLLWSWPNLRSDISVIWPGPEPLWNLLGNCKIFSRIL